MESKISQIIHKRVPQKSPILHSDIYYTGKSNFNALYNRAQNVLYNNFKKQGKYKTKGLEYKCETKLNDCPYIIIHGLGKTVEKAVELSLALQEKLKDIECVDIRIESVKLIDDVEEWENEEFVGEKSKSRMNSAIHIKLKRK